MWLTDESTDDAKLKSALVCFVMHYTVYGKTLRGITFVVFVGFQPIVKVFSLNNLLCRVHDGHGLMYRKSFHAVNSVFCA